MSGFRFGQKSMAVLLTVDERLQKVAVRALAKCPIDFGVVQGNRTRDMQMRLYGQGRTAAQCAAKGVPTAYAKPKMDKVTWTLNSDHIGGKAIDVCPWVGGVYDWDNNGKKGHWPKIAKAFKEASAELGIAIEWGGDWTETVDRPHFALK